MGLIYRIRAIIIQFREKIAKTTERRSPGNNSRRIAAKGQTLQPKGEMQMTNLGYQPKILLPDGEFFRFEIISADIEDSEYGYQLGLELKTLGGKHAGHTFKDWSKISGDEDDGLFIKEGSKAEELVKAVLGTDADLEDLAVGPGLKRALRPYFLPSPHSATVEVQEGVQRPCWRKVFGD